MSFVVEYLSTCWGVLLQMAPALLLGFLAAGAIAAFLPDELIRRHLGGKGLAPIAKAALLGVPMPLCSCGVLPVAAALKRSGASRGALAAFLISVPQTGADNILVVWSMLGLAFAIYSPISAFLSGLFGGAVCEYFGGAPMKPAEEGGDSTLNLDRPAKTPLSILRYACFTLVGDIAGALLLGLAIAGLVSTVVPEGWIADHVGPGFGAMVLMLLVGIPLYVCSSGSVPIAAAFMAKGASPGAALVFLVTGPASNATGIAAIAKMLGGRVAFLYIASLAVFAFVSGFAMNAVFGFLPETFVKAPVHVHAAGAGFFSVACALVLLALVMFAFLKGFFKRKGVEAMSKDKGVVALKVGGMSCNHCSKAVEGALKALPGVKGVSVDLACGMAYVQPAPEGAPDFKAMREAIEKLGFSCEPPK